MNLENENEKNAKIAKSYVSTCGVDQAIEEYSGSSEAEVQWRKMIAVPSRLVSMLNVEKLA
jgi:hypothetical protein